MLKALMNKSEMEWKQKSSLSNINSFYSKKSDKSTETLITDNKVTWSGQNMRNECLQ